MSSAARRLRARPRPRMPGDLGDRIGVLQQPRLVGAAAVVQHAVRIGEEDELALALERRLGVGRPRTRQAPARPASARARLVEHAAALQRRVPELVGVRLLPLAGETPASGSRRWASQVGAVNLRERAAGLLGRLQQDVARGAGVEHRLHHRLHQAADAGARGEIVPALERVVLRQQQVALRGGLVEEHRRRDLEGHLPELARRSRRPWAGRRPGWRRARAGTATWPPSIAVMRSRQRGVAVGRGQVGAELDGLADVAGHEVEQVDGRAELGGAGMLRADAAGDGQARRRGRELPGDALDPLGGHAGLLRGHRPA